MRAVAALVADRDREDLEALFKVSCKAVGTGAGAGHTSSTLLRRYLCPLHPRIEPIGFRAKWPQHFPNPGCRTYA